jgi:hypothetical protein
MPLRGDKKNTKIQQRCDKHAGAGGRDVLCEDQGQAGEGIGGEDGEAGGFLNLRAI